MGFYFRKAINIGPFRINLSKSGIGVSAGITGFRVGTGPKGAYVHAGRHGFYYRVPLGTKKNTNASKANFLSGQNVPDDTSTYNPRFVEIESANTDILTDISSKNLLDMINKSRNKKHFWPIILLCGFACAFIPFHPYNLICLGIGFIAAFLCYCYQDSKKFFLKFQNDENTKKSIEFMNNAVAQLQKCKRVWHIEGFVADYPLSIKRTQISITLGKPDLFNTNIEVYCIPVGKQKLYFFPDRLYVVENKKLAIISYSDIEISEKNVEMTETGNHPADSRVLSQTWAHTRLGGEPDKRYKSNHKIYTCEYTNIFFSSSTGLQEAIQVSNPKKAKIFKDNLDIIKNNIKILINKED